MFNEKNTVVVEEEDEGTSRKDETEIITTEKIIISTTGIITAEKIIISTTDILSSIRYVDYVLFRKLFECRLFSEGDK